MGGPPPVAAVLFMCRGYSLNMFKHDNRVIECVQQAIS